MNERIEKEYFFIYLFLRSEVGIVFSLLGSSRSPHLPETNPYIQECTDMLNFGITFKKISY
jgi:hypothetical protein